ncbi:MAG TPA: hypothetical protein VKS98_10835 [Chthoniobacterales bacterium]|nr:hypothetical protein [Chthoniobacterales bacterium]
MNRALAILVTAFALLVIYPSANASLIFLYDFPNDSGLAADQTNSQPSGATFGDWIRTGVAAVPNSGTDTFGSNNWSQNGSIDTNVFESFSITANGGFHLNLSSLTFSALRSATGPQNMEVGLFLNGSATVYATFDFSPTTTMAAYVFNFTALTDADNATTATFKFCGWNAGGPGGQVYLDDVSTYGDISNLPEVAPLLPVSLIIACSVFETHRRRARNRLAGFIESGHKPYWYRAGI